jgi:hypothetical protein
MHSAISRGQESNSLDNLPQGRARRAIKSQEHATHRIDFSEAGFLNGIAFSLVGGTELARRPAQPVHEPHDRVSFTPFREQSVPTRATGVPPAHSRGPDGLVARRQKGVTSPASATPCYTRHHDERDTFCHFFLTVGDQEEGGIFRRPLPPCAADDAVRWLAGICRRRDYSFALPF